MDLPDAMTSMSTISSMISKFIFCDHVGIPEIGGGAVPAEGGGMSFGHLIISTSHWGGKRTATESTASWS
jgi:hypothetical protein